MQTKLKKFWWRTVDWFNVNSYAILTDTESAAVAPRCFVKKVF